MQEIWSCLSDYHIPIYPIVRFQTVLTSPWFVGTCNIHHIVSSYVLSDVCWQAPRDTFPPILFFKISFPYLVSYFYFLGLFLTYSYVFSAFIVPCGLNSSLEFTGNLITELPYSHLISILDFFPALPLSVLPCWLNDTIQSYRPC